MSVPALGTLITAPATSRPDLLAPPVAAALTAAGEPHPIVGVAEIDPSLADTAAFCAAYDVSPAASANCVVLAGKREGVAVYAAALVLATTRADVNGVIRRFLGVRKISFAPMDDAVRLSGMEYGGITPIGLPAEWPVVMDEAVLAAGPVVIGSGVRRSKLVLEPAELLRLTGAQVLPAMAAPIPAG